MEAETAYAMLQEAYAAGLMAPRYCRWPDRPVQVRDSAGLASADRAVLFCETLVETREDSQWRKCADTRIIACSEPWDREVWRKTMIVSRRLNRVTFRSLTRSPSYRHRYAQYSLLNGWAIDKAMMDADPTIMQVHLTALAGLLGR